MRIAANGTSVDTVAVQVRCSRAMSFNGRHFVVGALYMKDDLVTTASVVLPVGRRGWIRILWLLRGLRIVHSGFGAGGEGDAEGGVDVTQRRQWFVALH
mmetsp:Transcript_20730/g.31108  ORF Transcript_20730/g.31108 Transcript_20730/m.31108 type:complete len:99 (-) Transcript_20730:23-319(-)